MPRPSHGHHLGPTAQKRRQQPEKRVYDRRLRKLVRRTASTELHNLHRSAQQRRYRCSRALWDMPSLDVVAVWNEQVFVFYA